MSPHGAAGSRWSTLALVVVAQFMVVLDITIVNVALPSIGADLEVAAADLQWVVTAYVVCSGGLLLLGGRAADRLGRRRVFLAGLTLFTAASLAAGLAPSAGALIGARVAQGVGAALLTPSALSILTTTYAGAQRATALSAWAAVASAGVAVGVVAGGMLTTWLSWEWVFLVNVPVGLAAIACTPLVVPRMPAQAGGGSLDVAGALTAVAGLALLVYGLAGAPEHGWGAAWTLAPIAGAAVLLAAFAGIERRVRDPLVPPRVWRVRSLVGGAGLLLAATGLLAGAFFLGSLYLQHELGWSALDTGLGFLPLVAAIGLGVHGAAHGIARAGSKALVVAGFGLVAAGALLLAAAPDHASYAADLLPGLLVLGLGMGIVFPALSITAMSEVGHDGAGVASGLVSTGHEIGAALGVAALAAVAGGSAAGPAGGFGDGALAAAAVAGVLALVAALRAPSVRPAPGHHVALH